MTSSTLAGPVASAVRKARWRLTPFLALMFALSMLDRSNVGFVKAALQTDANIDNAAFALGAGIFFFGYAVFEVPSNLIMHRVGAKLWMSRIMVTWGLASAAMMFVHDTTSFYVMRFILGVAEAGFSPGVILYATYWFPASERGKALGLYWFGAPVAFVLGGPISGALLQYVGGSFGLHGWQWMFLVEGIAASVVGVIAFFYLASRPRDAKWLTQPERDALEAVIAQEERSKVDHGPRGALAALVNGRVLYLVGICFTIQVCIYGLIFYLPTRISELTGDAIGMKVGMLTTIPWLCTLVALPFVTGYADRHGQHRRCAVAMLALAAGGIALSTFGHSIVFAFVALCIATVGAIIVQPLFWTLPASYLSGTAAASGIALIGSLGNLGGFVAPTLKTAVETAFASQRAGMFALAITGAIGVLMLVAGRPARPRVQHGARDIASVPGTPSH